MWKRYYREKSRDKNKYGKNTCNVDERNNPYTTKEFLHRCFW